ncbi:MAG: DUF1844 domain-containing protein [Acidobacteriia bacterium]|nr:DUF1844 domain-containing protein [Terriglobia bacterium]
MTDQEREEEFKVTDKRKFTADGAPRAEEEKSELEAPGEAAESETGPPELKTDVKSEDFQMTFETLVMSLSSTAMVQLGLIADPSTNQPAQNLPAAKHTIDILEILQQKTKGNLTASEQKLLDNILFELRMTYLELNQSIRIPK